MSTTEHRPRAAILADIKAAEQDIAFAEDDLDAAKEWLEELQDELDELPPEGECRAVLDDG